MINIKRHINWLTDISIIIVKWHILWTINTCSSMRSCPSEWLKPYILSLKCLYIISMVTNCVKYNQMARTRIWQNFRSQNDPVWSSRETLQHRAQGNINLLIVKYVQVWTAFCHKIFSWWPGILEMRHSEIRIPMICTMREGSFVKSHDWPLLCIEQHFVNLRKFPLHMI